MFKKSAIISLIVPYAKMLQKDYNLLPSVTISQAILQSDWLREKVGNNVFNLIWHKGCDLDYEIGIALDWFKGFFGPTVCRLKIYESYKESFCDYASILTTTERYIPVLNAATYKEACIQLEKCGYCTMPKYAANLISIIEDHELYKYDCEDDYEEYNLCQFDFDNEHYEKALDDEYYENYYNDECNNQHYDNDWDDNCDDRCNDEPIIIT